MEDERKKLFLEALGNVAEKRKADRDAARFSRDLDKSQNLAKGALDKETMSIKGKMEDLTPERIKVGKTDKIDKLGEVVPKTDIKDFSKRMKDLSMKQDLKATMRDAISRGDDDMIRKLQKIGKGLSKGASKGLKAFPLIGGVLGAIASGDASAAIPVLGDVEGAGMSPEDEAMFIAEQEAKSNYMKSQAHRDRLNALKKLSGE